MADELTAHAGRADAAGIGVGPHPEPNHSQPPTLEPTMPETTNPQADARPEQDDAAYTDWHYEQFGCAPTTGQGPAPQNGDDA